MWGKVKFMVLRFFQAVKASHISILFTLGVVLGGLDTYYWEWLLERPDSDEESKKYGITIIHWITFCVSAAGIFLVAARLKSQDLQRIDDRFNAAVQILGSGETSARTGAIFSLYYLAMDNAKYRRQIAQILCSHIRSKTQEEKYQEEHKKSPSNEIQTTIDLLFKGILGQEGLYYKFEPELPVANLSGAYLSGANFLFAHCERAYFAETNCERAFFNHANCKEIEFEYAHCERAVFNWADCKGASFKGAHCEGAHFVGASCQGASFEEAHCERVFCSQASCQGAYFKDACCEGALFYSSNFQGADFSLANCQGADFSCARCEGASFRRAHCEGVNFSGTQCQGVEFTDAHCEGAYTTSGVNALKLADRIGEKTQFDNMIIFGEFSESSIRSFKSAEENAKRFLSEDWYVDMKKLIDENKGKSIVRGKPEGIIEGVLEDSEELRILIKRLEEIVDRGLRLDE